MSDILLCGILSFSILMHQKANDITTPNVKWFYFGHSRLLCHSSAIRKKKQYRKLVKLISYGVQLT